MSSPPRLRDTHDDPLARALLRAATREGPPEASRARAYLAAGLGAPGASGAPPAVGGGHGVGAASGTSGAAGAGAGASATNTAAASIAGAVGGVAKAKVLLTTAAASTHAGAWGLIGWGAGGAVLMSGVVALSGGFRARGEAPAAPPMAAVARAQGGVRPADTGEGTLATDRGALAQGPVADIASGAVDGASASSINGPPQGNASAAGADAGAAKVASGSAARGVATAERRAAMAPVETTPVPREAADPPAAIASAPSPSGLADEVAEIDAARRALAEGRAADVLRVLDGYDARHAHGALAPEAQALRVDALARTGNARAADALGRRFLRDYPGSPQAARVRATIEKTSAP